MANNYTVTGLTSGQSYTYSVKSRNIVGLSTESQALTLVACQEPSTPPTPMTTIDEVANTVTISWSLPANNGSPITGYTILIRTWDLETF
jgi:large repetitive protein